LDDAVAQGNAALEHAGLAARIGARRTSQEYWLSMAGPGGAGVAHALRGVAVDLPLLVGGVAGLLWALVTRRPAHLLAGIVLVAVALFALLDDHGILTGP